ncbi:hypothetical protein AcW2_004640 [Taiwanofungus camphoratus]|nr:hypothetical protein AcW2_004640 [Antrodia cinnamomea]
MSDLTKVTPPTELNEAECFAVFQHVFRRLAAYRNTAVLYASAEYSFSALPEEQKTYIRNSSVEEVNEWAQELLKHVWIACREPGAWVPTLDPLTDTSTTDLPSLPATGYVTRLSTTVLFLHVASTRAYSARTRVFLFSITSIDEGAVAATLKDPGHAIEEAQRKTKRAREESAQEGKTLRRLGIGLGAVAGGVLIGVTGGLAAPLVGAGVSAALGWLGVGGTVAGILASGLASSSVVCGALFGAYGSRKAAETVDRFTKEIRDLAVVPVREPKNTMAVRLCVSGWLDSKEDVIAPWTIFEGDDTFALQWEVEALENLSNALSILVKAQAMKWLKAEIIKRTVFASLFAALSPTSWLKIAQIIDNPWMTAKSLAVKSGKVLGKLLAQRVLGNRPVTLVGYSLGSLVVFEALQYLASLPPSESAGLVQDVFLFASPVSTDEPVWASVRRVVAGRLVNGYGSNDYVLAVLCRVSHITWSVAGLEPVPVKGVENLACNRVDGHLKWRGMIGQCLEDCEASGVISSEVKKQMEHKEGMIEAGVDLDEKEVNRIIEEGPE